MSKRTVSTLLAILLFTSLLLAVSFAAETSGYPPNAEINYNYSADVECGTIRYISQIESSTYFNWDYWPEKYSLKEYKTPETECGTSCISMALSYVGVNKTPYDILVAHDGVTHFTEWGDASSSSPSISSGMSNYINGNGKYSPVVICLPHGGSDGNNHYIMLMGKISDSSYQVLDPASDNIRTLSISGSTVTYNGSTFTIKEVYQWYNPNAVLDRTPPEIVDNTVDVSGLVTLSDGTSGFRLTFDVLEDQKIEDILVRVWQYGQSPSEAVTIPANYSFQANENTSVAAEVSLKNDFDIDRNEGIFYYNIWVSDGSNTVDYVVDLKNNVCTGINLFSSTPSKKVTGSYKVIEDTYLRDAPYEKWNGKNTRRENNPLPKGGIITCVGKYTNAVDHDWYQIEDGRWVYGDRIKKYTTWAQFWDKVKNFELQAIYWINGQVVKAAGGNTKLLSVSIDNSTASFTVVGTVHSGGSAEQPASYANVVFDATGGYCQQDSGSYQVGAAYGWLPTPTRFGYTFDGWFTDADGGTQVTASDVCPAEGATLYAHWTRIILLQGSCGDDMTFILYGDGELDITGSGEMTSHPWTKDYAKNVFLLNMDGEISSIASEAFKNCIYLYEANIPDSVTTIKASAFNCCESLQSVVLPKNLATLEESSFRDCTALTEIFIPKTLQIAGFDSWGSGFGPFTGSGIEKAAFEEASTAVPGYLFYRADKLKSISLPDSITKIGESAFQGCTSLEAATLPKNLATLEESSFRDCTALTEIFIPKTLQIAGFDSWGSGFGPFTGSGIEKAAFENNTTIIPSYIFYGAEKLNNVTIPTSVTTIDSYSFYNTGLVEFTVPEQVKEIGKYCFSQSNNLKSIVWNHVINEIPEAAFKNCASLVNVVINENVTSFGNSCFYNCDSLKYIPFSGSLKYIHNYAFYDCDALENAIINKGVVSIDNAAFYDCDMLSTVSIPDTITSIEKKAFYNCDSLKNITIPSSVITIKDQAFYDCDALLSISIPSSVTTLGSQVFYDCDTLTTAIIGDGIATLSSKLFYDCDALTDVTLGNGLKTIGDSVFEHCDALEKVTLPYQVTKIGSNVFKDCVKFTELTIPRATTSIADNAVSYADILTIYGVAGTTAETYANSIGATFVAINKPMQSIQLSEQTLSMNRGATVQLIPTFSPVDFTDQVAWKSSDTSIATVDSDGNVKAVSVGTATISLVGGKCKATCKVTVVQPVTGISLNKYNISLDGGQTFQLKATVNPSNAANKAIVWSSSDETIATVTDTGLVTALKKGTATITCAAQDGSGITETCTVTVTNTLNIVTSVADLQSAHDYADNCNDVWQYSQPGQTSLSVTFSEQTAVEEGSDFIFIYDKDGNQIGKYTGTELAGQTITVPGDTVRIKLVSDNVYTEYGFAVTRVNNVNADGTTIPTGWQKEDGQWRYYNDAGEMQTGWLKQDGKWYFLDSEGVMRKGWVKSNGNWYYMDSHGVMVTGWKQIKEQWYYFDSHGAMVTGKQTIAGKQYSFDESGVMQTGWQKSNGKWYYYESSGAAKTGWVNSNGKWYYMDRNGAMMTGWIKVNDIWYYMDGTGAMTTGWLYQNDHWYYMDNLGHMLTGWVYLEPERYYMDEHGVMVTGWKKIDGKWYYFAANGKMVTGWQKINEKWYYFNANGSMRTGWLKSGGQWYYMESSGVMHTGWLQLKDKWYYFGTGGKMVTGTQVINGKTRTFDENGVWLGD